MAKELVVQVRAIGVLLRSEQVLLQYDHVQRIQWHHNRLDEERHVHDEVHAHEKGYPTGHEDALCSLQQQLLFVLTVCGFVEVFGFQWFRNIFSFHCPMKLASSEK